MTLYRKQTVLAAACLLLAGAARAAVSVDYVHPETFSDLPRAPYQRQQALDDVAEHFRKLGEGLRPGQDLAIEVLDIDLAGREEPNRFGGDELRVMHGGADWPRMRLRYTLSEQGRTIASGEAQLADQNYAVRINSYPSDARWPHEMQMIDEWWRKTIAPLGANQR
jgi:hypothetical protein